MYGYNRDQNNYRSMGSTKNKLIVANWIISFLSLSVSIADLVLRVVKNQTGIGLSYFYPYCTQLYYNAKFGFTYRSLLVEFCALGLSILCSLIVFIVLLVAFKKVCSSQPQQINLQGDQLQNATVPPQAAEVEVKNELVYIMAAIVLFSWIVVGGKAIQYFIEGGNCLVISSLIENIILYISMAGLFLAFTLYVLILILIAQRPPPVESINLQELKGGSKQSQEDEQYNRRIYGEAKSYLAYMSKKREETQKGLLGYDQIYYPPVFNNNINNQNGENESEYTYYYSEVEVDNEQDFEVNQKGQIEIKAQGNKLKAGAIPEEESIGQSVEAESPGEPNSHSRQPTPGEKPNLAKLLKSNKNVLIIKGTSSKIVQEESKEGESELDSNLKLQENEDLNVPQQMKKILKMTLFDNSKFLPSKQKLQSQCPISKYLQKDQKQQITQNNYKFKGKNKKNLNEKEQLVFQKKKKEVFENIKNEFDESEFIRKTRKDRFGQEWVQEREIEEKLLKKDLSQRFQKRQGLEFIRGKYNN